MAVSQAKLDANRQNAKKSTGPRTEAGKNKSKFNALDHGCRAATLVLAEEDAQALEARLVAWGERFLPRDDAEAYFLEDAVVNSWMLDRARRAQAARLTTHIDDYGADRDLKIAKEVAALGRRLFKDRLGPLALHPTQRSRIDCVRDESTSFDDRHKGLDPDHPADIVLCLESTACGCEWMIKQWNRLRSMVERDKAWLPSDKLKAVRLLGMQPLDAIDEEDVAMVYLASFTLKPDKGSWDWEISTELSEKDLRRFRTNAARRELDALKPKDAAEARQALLAVIERATRHLSVQAERRRERDQVDAARAADRLAFDDSAEGERLRRFELASGRAMYRSLDKMIKLVGSPLPVVSCEELVDGSSSVVSCEEVVSGPSSVVSCPVLRIAAPGAPAEAAAVSLPDLPNEPTGAWGNCANEPTAFSENAPNEPTESFENLPGEPAAGASSVVRSPLLVEGCDAGAVGEPNAPNEPTKRPRDLPNRTGTAPKNGDVTGTRTRLVIGALVGCRSSP